ncbi:MAG: alpha/beta fold hydrolase [Bdellovibrionales bacterium]
MMLFGPASTRALKIPLPNNGGDLDVEITEGQGPTFVWLCGYASDINGNKATYLKEQCEAWGYRLIRFNHRFVGKGDDAFKNQTMSNHLEDACEVLRQLTDDKVILIGSSMGGWVGLRLLQLHPEKVAGFIGVAASPDFTKTYADAGIIKDVEDYPSIHTPFIQDAKKHFVLDNHITGWSGSAAFVQGQLDKAVPWKMAFKIAKKMTDCDDITVHVIKDGGHALSRPQDLELIWQVVNNVREKVIGPAEKV